MRAGKSLGALTEHWRSTRPALRGITIAALALIAVAALGFVAGRWVRSPAQVLADSAPPPTALLTAQVSEGRIHRTTSFDVTFNHRYETPVNALNLDSSAARNIVTDLRVGPGRLVSSGDALLAINGAPVFVLPGTLPSYRDIGPGSTGPDVAALQSALVRSGLLTRGSFSSSSFDQRTSIAVGRMFGRAGYVFGRPGAGPTSLRAGALVFVPQLPARVAELKVHRGSEATGHLFSLVGGGVVARGTVPPGVDSVHLGARARLLVDNGSSITAQISAVTSSGSGQQVALEVAPFAARQDTLIGHGARALVTTFQSASVELTVPETAVSTDMSGRDFILVLRRDGHPDRVDVRVSESGDGMAAIKPLASGGFTTGTRVVIGRGS